MTILKGSGVRRHQGLNQDQLSFRGLVRDRKIKAFELVKGEDRLIISRHAAANEHLEGLRSSRYLKQNGDQIG